VRVIDACPPVTSVIIRMMCSALGSEQDLLQLHVGAPIRPIREVALPDKAAFPLLLDQPSQGARKQKTRAVLITYQPSTTGAADHASGR
jgi:hypothetical protein